VTAIVGILCKDGVVVGADSAVTFAVTPQFASIEQKANKVSIVGNHVIIAGTGDVGLAQRFGNIVEQALKADLFARDKFDVVKLLARETILDLQQTFAKLGQYGALVGFCCQEQACLCEFAVADFQPEFKTLDGIWYGSIGSTQFMTDPFLGLLRDVFWSEGPPTVSEGEFAVTATLEHAIGLNPGGVAGPIQIGVLKRESAGSWAARLLTPEDVYEHSQSVKAARQHLRGFRKTQQPAAADDLPDVPKP